MSDDPLHLSRLIAQVNRRIETTLAATLKAKGLSIEHFRILAALSEMDGRTMGDLADQALVDRPTMTKMIDRLAAAGSVYRAPDPKDRRKVLVFIADHGRDLFRQGVDPARTLEAELMAGIDSADRRELTRILRHLAV